MRITIASGKGGTGKTTVATSLAVTAAAAAEAAAAGDPVQLLDCDVEAPNCHLFLPTEWEHTEVVTMSVPVIDNHKCNGCGECGQICEFNALAVLPSDVLVFPELCHGCGGCWLVCPEQAISQGAREIGWIEQGRSNGVLLTRGRLKIGETQAPHLVRRVKALVADTELQIVDGAPGPPRARRPSLEESDFVVLVTEPTPFGLNDLILAVELVRQLQLRCGVVINRADIGDDRVRRYCRAEGIDVLLEIPHDRRIAEAYSRGETAALSSPRWREVFAGLLDTLRSCVQEGVR